LLAEATVSLNKLFYMCLPLHVTDAQQAEEDNTPRAKAGNNRQRSSTGLPTGLLQLHQQLTPQQTYRTLTAKN
jgi:hypothetical protein